MLAHHVGGGWVGGCFVAYTPEKLEALQKCSEICCIIYTFAVVHPNVEMKVYLF